MYVTPNMFESRMKNVTERGNQGFAVIDRGIRDQASGASLNSLNRSYNNSRLR